MMACRDNDLDLKVKAAIRTTRAAIPHLKKSKGAAICNVLAIQGKAPGASSVPTSVSRAAGLALTKALSRDLGPAGIRVTAVCIGLVRSAQIERFAAAQNKSWEEFDKSMAATANIPLGRLGRAEEAAETIAFLVGPQSSFLVGLGDRLPGCWLNITVSDRNCNQHRWWSEPGFVNQLRKYNVYNGSPP